MHKPDETELGTLLKAWAERHRPASTTEADLVALLAAVLSGRAAVDPHPLDRLVADHARRRRRRDPTRDGE